MARKEEFDHGEAAVGGFAGHFDRGKRPQEPQSLTRPRFRPGGQTGFFSRLHTISTFLLLHHAPIIIAVHGCVRVRASTEDIKLSGRILDERERDEGDHRFGQWTAGVRRALIVVVVFFIFQQITGINIPLYYGPHLLAPFFQSGSTALKAAVAGVQATLIISAVNVGATYFGFRYIDRLGRRKLSMGGYAGMAVFMIVSAIGVGYLTGIPEVVMVVTGLCLFIASFAMGVGGTGWLIQGEVFPTAVRGRAASVGTTADWLANFAVLIFFPIWQSGIGLGWVMVCFAALSVLAIAFYLPEAKGLSVEEITQVSNDRPIEA